MGLICVKREYNGRVKKWLHSADMGEGRSKYKIDLFIVSCACCEYVLGVLGFGVSPSTSARFSCVVVARDSGEKLSRDTGQTFGLSHPWETSLWQARLSALHTQASYTPTRVLPEEQGSLLGRE